MNNNDEFHIKVDPRILKILSENLYTNIYYVIAELIANAYDADAHNVHLEIFNDFIAIEDDGNGMTREQIDGYLNVGLESRTDESNSFTKSGRRKMGRKGVGKLAALSISSQYSLMTKNSNDYYGFIVKKDIDEFGRLDSIQVDQKSFKFNKLHQNGTRIEIYNCTVNIHKDIEIVAKNILKIFPVISENFKIHIHYNDKIKILDNYDNEIISQLATITIIGDDYKKLKKHFNTDNSKFIYREVPEIVSDVFNIVTKDGQNVKRTINIKGWIGSYITTRGRSKIISDFPDNHISIFANGKLGEFNILPIITTTRMTEQYIVGNLYIDIFEESILPDMSLSNRQGYNTNDIRYIKAMEKAKELLQQALNLHDQYIIMKDEEKNKRKLENELRQEENLKQEVDAYTSKVKEKIINKFANKNKLLDRDVDDILDGSMELIQLKNKVKNQKKKILISHTGRDKKIADVVYELLINNGFERDEIIYTNCDYQESRILGGPSGYKIWDYLKDFFVKSYVKQGIYVIFIHSKFMKESWGAVVEVGAEWITRNTDTQHCIVNIENENENCNINEPLQNGGVYISVKRNSDNEISCYTQNADSFCQIIESIAEYFNKSIQPRKYNLHLLAKLIKIE